MTAAHKAASASVRNCAMLRKYRSALIACPLQTIVSYGGFVVLCTALLPITPGTLVCGSIDGGKVFTKKCRSGALPPPYQEAIQMLMSCIGIKDPPIDFQIHAGGDGRVCLTSLSRLLPSTTVSDLHPSGFKSLYKFLRPELVAAFHQHTGIKLLPDAFNAGRPGTPDSDSKLSTLQAIQFLRTHACQRVASVFSDLEFPREVIFTNIEQLKLSGSSTEIKCRKCDCNVLDETELTPRFGCCTAGCCFVCLQCYVQLCHEEGDCSIGHCDQKGEIRPINGFSMFPDVEEIFHFYGVNMRYLGIVYSSLTGYRAVTQHYLKVEMICRTFKSIISSKMRTESSKGPENVLKVYGSSLRSLLMSNGRSAELFWREELGPAMSSKFSLHMPFPTESIDKGLVLDQVSKLVGISHSHSTLKVLLSEGKLILTDMSLIAVAKQQNISLITPVPPTAIPFSQSDSDCLRKFWKRHLAASKCTDPTPPYISELLANNDGLPADEIAINNE